MALLHGYILYPLILKVLAHFTSPPPSAHSNENNSTAASMPAISILMAAYNEEKVIGEKIQSILLSNYPTEKIEILVGSDSSTDSTNPIVQSFAGVKLIAFEQRSGKVKIINQLVAQASHPLLILTDANVLFDKDTLFHLTKHFTNEAVSLVDSAMISTHRHTKNVAQAESTYLRGERAIKYHEGTLWGLMMGPFGGCFALRKKDFHWVPENFLVDDFYINMKVLASGKKAISEPQAKVYESIPTNWVIEFKRKVRIAAGSYQNLLTFFPLLFKFNLLAFCFLSHKVIRWKGPFLMIGLYLSNTFLLLCLPTVLSQPVYLLVFVLQNSVILLFLLRCIGVKNAITQLSFHFITTNTALLMGFIQFLMGIHSSIWKPTERE
jgi:cellulose synthase/poly-beta-1,6-N-acetylglucosamine synthase-like glycosyltransferase